MRIGPTQQPAWPEPAHRVRPEDVALMMQALGTNLPRPVRAVPYPEPPPEPRVRAIPAIEAYREQARERQPNYIDEYC